MGVALGSALLPADGGADRAWLLLFVYSRAALALLLFAKLGKLVILPGAAAWTMKKVRCPLLVSDQLQPLRGGRLAPAEAPRLFERTEGELRPAPGRVRPA